MTPSRATGGGGRQAHHPNRITEDHDTAPSAPGNHPAPFPSRTDKCPFVVVVDTREQRPYTFKGVDASRRAKNGERIYLRVEVMRDTLSIGDYSIHEHQQRVTVERKSLPDLFGSVGRFENFERRLTAMNESYQVAAVVVEGELSSVLAGPPPGQQYNSRITPRVAFNSINTWTQKFPRVHWWFVPGRDAAQLITFRILERYWIRYQQDQAQAQGGNAK